jgi:hypothetical protein
MPAIFEDAFERVKELAADLVSNANLLRLKIIQLPSMIYFSKLPPRERR